jgi:CYTH domain-containing protein
MQTTAIGAEEFYTLANNSARRESPEEARELDGRTFAAWKRHYHPRLIGNETDFATKKRRVLEEICVVIGHPKPLEYERKFVIKKFNPRDITVPYSVSEIYQYYLRPRSTGVECRIRSRQDEDGTVFYLTEKVDMGRGMRSEKEIVLSPDEYSRLLSEVDTSMGGIRKIRFCFFWKGRFFEADIFISHRGLCTVEVECMTFNINDKIEFPPFFKVIEEVTGKKEYSNYHISRFGIPQN